MDSLSIRVDIEELMDKLSEMLSDEFATVELTITTLDHGYSDSLHLKAINISEEDDADYGEVGSVSEEF